VAFDSYAGIDEGSLQFTTSINNTVSLTSQSFLDTKLPRLSKNLSTTANNNNKNPSSLHKIATPLPRTETPLWDEPLQLAGIDRQDLQPILYLDNHDTHTQLWAYWNYDEKVLCISFRGTEQDQWQDLLTDITLTPIGLDIRKITDCSDSDSLIKAEDQDDDDDSWFSVNKVAEATKAQILSASQDQTTSSGNDDKDDKDDDRKKSANNDSSTTTAKDTVEAQVASAIHTIHNTAQDLQRALERVKMGFDQYNLLTGTFSGTEDGKSTSCSGTDQTSSTPETDHNNNTTFSSSSSSNDDKQKSPTWVHSGFLHAYDSVRPDIYKIIDTVLKKEPKGEWTVITTGHSLGGALATLCAFDIALRKRWTGNNYDDDDNSSSNDKPALKMYNYGSPRVGNKEFAEQFDAAVPDAWRIVNGNDVVCGVPRLLGYCHVGHEVRLGTAAAGTDDNYTNKEEKEKKEEEKKAEVKIQHSSEKREAASVSDILPSVAVTIPAIAGSIVGRVLSSGDSAGDGSSREMEEKKKAEEAQMLWEAEKEAWAALFDAEALNCHMEALYLESLKTLI
jgi:hypothetical protein